MAIHVALHHRTSYRYDRPIRLGPQTVRLRPAPHCRTPVLSYSLKVEPEGYFINWQQDPQGNYLARLVFPEPTPSFSVEVDLVAEMAVFNPFDFFLEPSAENFPFSYEPKLAVELAPYLRKDPITPAFETFIRSLDLHPKRTIDFLVGLNLRIHQAVRYIIRMEPGVQSADETLTKGCGSCRDSGWLMVQVFRHLGLAARFVSGYLIQLRADVKAIDGPSGTTQDFTDLHAWCEVYLPGAGWIGLDPTSGLFAGEGHLPLACSPEPSSAAPITGIVERSQSTFDFAMKVTRIFETPRVTFPYPDETWTRINALGEKIDATLKARDVRLTMGGEPTFVSIDDMNGPEWNTSALGPKKRELAAQLFKRMWTHFGPGGFVHHGQGKWYPGEPLPRWALTCVWRKDGKPIWKNPALLADPLTKASRDAADAQRFAAALANQLGVGEERLVPGYEDAFYYIWKERRLPAGLDPAEKNLSDADERARLGRLLETGLEKVTGYALPLLRDPKGKWLSGPWFFRAGRMYLVPGDSPMGLRMPLNLQPWYAPPDNKPAAGEPAAAPEVRIALCVEVRGGHLHLFMPPYETAADYLSLTAAIEATATELSMPVILEGYLPPHDPALDNIKVTPDPGVIEINVNPSASWRELADKTEWLYDTARECRLGAEKFMIDGRHTGTGGGNHMILGGAKPEDSPLLRRPHLLKSMLAYWHQHPSLSYLFSGLFVGPTSQSPRIDEARNDSLYELEIAFRELDCKLASAPGGPNACPPWLVDRIFRNLLTDITGNTHRAEFCIDKLYSPDSNTGRLGLLELRGFEMPPHARMSLAQQLLLRALVSHFWDHPFAPKRLTRWDTDLHDRFMLPHFIRTDFDEVISDLKSWGLPFEESWFAPHLEFRFPLYGRVRYREIEIELRHALEPWHVMGEENTGGGTVRFVDSSVERMQVKVTGLTADRYFVSCNGARVPLQPTGVKGELVAGVRYRAWQPPSALHPTIGIDSPLIFDVVDSWNQKSLGGCTYHVTHPGGRNYTTMPVNSYEAESRRLARFFPFGHTPGQNLPLSLREIAPEFPHTLDLRDPVKVTRS
ncbi:MAG: transglutaminase family protein [Opitutaceae bacterium]